MFQRGTHIKLLPKSQPNKAEHSFSELLNKTFTVQHYDFKKTFEQRKDYMQLSTREINRETNAEQIYTWGASRIRQPFDSHLNAIRGGTL